MVVQTVYHYVGKPESVSGFSIGVRGKTLNADFRHVGFMADDFDQLVVCCNKVRELVEGLGQSKEEKKKIKQSMSRKFEGSHSTKLSTAA